MQDEVLSPNATDQAPKNDGSRKSLKYFVSEIGQIIAEPGRKDIKVFKKELLAILAKFA